MTKTTEITLNMMKSLIIHIYLLNNLEKNLLVIEDNSVFSLKYIYLYIFL